MLNEHLMTFEEWQNHIFLQGTALPEDVTKQVSLYEDYVRKYSKKGSENAGA